MARLNTYDYNLCVEICNEVVNGKNIKDVLNSNEDYPTFQTWCNWKRDNQELFDLYIKSMQDKAEALEQEMDLYKDMLLTKDIDPSTYNTLVQTLKWKMAKFYPKLFGDKQHIDHTTNGKEINQPPIFGEISLNE
jgi:arginyl-tRNA--protein-N-Asp/Glu arginylyltransferase